MGFSRQEYWSGLPFPSPIKQSSNFSVVYPGGQAAANKNRKRFAEPATCWALCWGLPHCSWGAELMCLLPSLNYIFHLQHAPRTRHSFILRPGWGMGVAFRVSPKDKAIGRIRLNQWHSGGGKGQKGESPSMVSIVDGWSPHSLALLWQASHRNPTKVPCVQRPGHDLGLLAFCGRANIAGVVLLCVKSLVSFSLYPQCCRARLVATTLTILTIMFASGSSLQGTPAQIYTSTYLVLTGTLLGRYRSSPFQRRWDWDTEASLTYPRSQSYFVAALDFHTPYL